MNSEQAERVMGGDRVIYAGEETTVSVRLRGIAAPYFSTRDGWISYRLCAMTDELEQRNRTLREQRYAGTRASWEQHVWAQRRAGNPHFLGPHALGSDVPDERAPRVRLTEDGEYPALCPVCRAAVLLCACEATR